MTAVDPDERGALDRRRATYRQLVDGELASGDGDRYTFLVRSVDLRTSGPDLAAAAGLGLALVERGHGVRLVPQHRWHLGGSTDVWVAATPEVDPSLAPADAWKVAWAHGDIDEWAALDHLVAFDRVLAGSEIGLVTLRRRTPRATHVLRTGVDAELFVPGERPPRGGRQPRRARRPRPQHPAAAHRPAARGAAHGVRRAVAQHAQRPARPPGGARALAAGPRRARQRPAQRRELPASAVAHGTLSALVYESLAAGALPVLNSRLGTVEVGLDLPTYTTSEELADVITAHLADPEGTTARAAQLRDVVLDGHTWDHRAAQLDGLVRARRRTTLPAPPARALHYFPDYNRANPYQGMLFAGLDSVDAYPVAVADVVAHLENRAVSAVPGTLNIHWTTPILQYAAGPYRAAIELDRFSAALHKFRAAGGRLVWTLHNVLPHEAKHVWAETQLAQLLADRADAIHALAEITARQASEVLRLDPRKVVVIEHSSYLGRYPQWISREAARAQLGFGPDDKVLVALGGIRPYKGLGRLLDVFHELADEDPALQLLVAGKPAQTQETAGLERRCEQSPRVRSEFSHVPDDQLQVWFGAADLAVLPYSRILNSGVFWLAQTFGLPIVGPRTGALLDLADEPHVRLFNPRDDRSLKETLRAAVHDLVDDPERAEHARAASLATARSRPPHRMAADFATFIEPLLGTDRAPRRATG